MAIGVTVIYFASLRDAAGRSEESAQLNQSTSVKEIFAVLGATHPALKNHLPTCRLALNGEFANGRVKLKPGDELAILPPVAGG